MRRLWKRVHCRTMQPALALAIVICAGAPALAQEDQGPQRRAVIGLEMQGFDRMFPDENDAGLKRALSMIPDRIKEILETPEVAQGMDDPFPRELLYAMLDNLGGPMRMIITQRGFDQETGQPRLGGVVSMHMRNGEEAKRMHREIERLRQQVGEEGPNVQPSERFNGMNDVMAPFGVLSYGPREANDGWRYEVIYGDIPDADNVFGLLPAPAMQGSVARGVIDFAAASPFTAMLAGMANLGGGEAGMVVDWVKSMGLLGPNAIAAEWEVGYPGEYARETWRIKRAGQYVDGLGLTRTTIDREVLEVLPSDASFMSIQKMDLQRDLALFKEIMGGLDGGYWEEVKAEIQAALGVDIEADFINALGKTVAMYFADSSGGGSIFSTVALVELSDPRTMLETLNKLADRLNAVIAAEVDTDVVSVKMDRFTHQGVPFMSMRVRGMPLPSVPTMAVVGNWLVIGATPQGCMAGAAQVRGTEGTSALRHRSLSALGIRGGKATRLMVIDPVRTIRDGYGVTALLCSMLENAVRSPHGDRDPGVVMPVYAQLAMNPYPIVITSSWDGDDYIVETLGDRSTLVNVAAVLGVGDLGEMILGAALGGGIAAGICQEAMKDHSDDWEDWDEDHDMDGHDEDAWEDASHAETKAEGRH